jgi:hypothetical protein
MTVGKQATHAGRARPSHAEGTVATTKQLNRWVMKCFDEFLDGPNEFQTIYPYVNPMLSR